MDALTREQSIDDAIGAPRANPAPMEWGTFSTILGFAPEDCDRCGSEVDQAEMGRVRVCASCLAKQADDYYFGVDWDP